MLTVLAIVALVLAPYILDVDLNLPQGVEPVAEEYIPDGR